MFVDAFQPEIHYVHHSFITQLETRNVARKQDAISITRKTETQYLTAHCRFYASTRPDRQDKALCPRVVQLVRSFVRPFVHLSDVGLILEARPWPQGLASRPNF